MADYRTFLSPVFYKKIDGDKVKLVPLKIDDQEIHWFDELLGGALRLPSDLFTPNGGGRPLLMLLAGAAGTGKSTFALQLCCQMARAGRMPHGPKADCYYWSTEEDAQRLVAKAQQFGWCNGERMEKLISPLSPTDAVPRSSVLIAGTEKFLDSPNLNEVVRRLMITWDENREAYCAAHKSEPDNLRERCLDVLVLDSLNVLSPIRASESLGTNEAKDERADVFDTVYRRICDPKQRWFKPLLVIIILDAAIQNEHSLYWEYIADIVFRFGWSDEREYALRTFEIAKMRGQIHVLGKQRLKLYGGPKEPTQNANEEQPPYLEHGGVFVFPSIHWHLSRLSGRSLSEKSMLELPEEVKLLGEQISGQISGGFPKFGCTVLSGERGATKSYLGYLFLLDQAIHRGRNTLLISFRDDEEATKFTMRRIMRGHERQGDVTDLIKEDKLEILYNEIGCISPEEFFHKIYVAVNRPRANSKKAEVVLINGLDQMSSRYPLIASEVMFVPALIQFFRASRLCVVVISATGEALTTRGKALYGLPSMADLLIKFTRYNPLDMTKAQLDPKLVPEPVLMSPQVAMVETVRVPGGHIGGQIGFLYREKAGLAKMSYALARKPGAG